MSRSATNSPVSKAANSATPASAARGVLADKALQRTA
jgi:hypothetical protein